MRRLLEDFDDLFDLTHRIGDATLGDLLEQTVDGLGQSSQNWEPRAGARSSSPNRDASSVSTTAHTCFRGWS